MYFKPILLIIVVFFNVHSYAQEKYNMIDMLNIKEDIVYLESRISTLIKRDAILSKRRGLQQFHIFWLGTDYSIQKKNYSNHSFLYKLYPTYWTISSGFLFFKKEKKYLKTESFITDSIGNFVAKADARSIYNFLNIELENIELVNVLYEKKINFIFYMGGTLSTYIGIKDNSIYVIKSSKEGLKAYPLEKFIICCYDDWIPY